MNWSYHNHALSHMMLACMIKYLPDIGPDFQITNISPVGGGAAPQAQLLTRLQDPWVHNTEWHPTIPVHQSAQAAKLTPVRGGAIDVTFIKCALISGPKRLWATHAWTNLIAPFPDRNMSKWSEDSSMMIIRSLELSGVSITERYLMTSQMESSAR